MSDLMQLLAEHNFKDLGRSPDKTCYDHDNIYMYLLNGDQIDLYIIIAAVEQMLPYMLCTRKNKHIEQFSTRILDDSKDRFSSRKKMHHQ